MTSTQTTLWIAGAYIAASLLGLGLLYLAVVLRRVVKAIDVLEKYHFLALRVGYLPTSDYLRELGRRTGTT